ERLLLPGRADHQRHRLRGAVGARRSRGVRRGDGGVARAPSRAPAGGDGVTLTDAPALHLAFASLHVLVGHFGAAAVDWLRFRRSPLVLYRSGPSPHQQRTRAVALVSLGWAAVLVASATSSAFRASALGRA